MRNRYFNYLCDLINPDKKKYYHLLGALDHFYFVVSVSNDDNRSADGMKLREDFIDANKFSDDLILEFMEQVSDCTVLEMMIGLSYRLEFETAQSRWEKTPSEWFWILIDNLRLTDADDYSYMKGDVRNRVRNIIMTLVNREYDVTGDGGLFPLRYTKNDQRNVEIWYQMTEYILENYPI